MAWPLVAAGAISAISAYQSSRAQARAFRRQAREQNRQADEFLRRFELNAEFERLEGQGFAETQQAAFAKGGVALGSGVSLNAVDETARRVERNIRLNEMEAEAQADAIRAGAAVSRQNASSAIQQGNARILGGFADAFTAGQGGGS